MANNNLDLNELANRVDHQLSISLNTDDPLKRESEIRLKEADAKHLRTKELLLHGLTSAIITIVVLLCAWIVIQKSLSTDEGKLALGLLTTIVSALLGYITGKSAK
jgi:hypothetical protein